MPLVRLTIVIAAALSLSSIALAEPARGKPCAADVKAFCSGVQAGSGRITACIRPHLAGLSQTCEDRVLTEAVTAKVCAADVARLCAGVVRGTGGVRSCIKSHMAEISEPCKDAMSRTAAGRRLLGRGAL
jgi:hypothetical protein